MDSHFLQLHFALSGASSWNIVDINFNYEEFYNSIVDYFEVTLGPAAKAVIDELLVWWDKCVYFIRALLTFKLIHC